MSTHSEISRESKALLPYTCSDIDSIFDTANSSVKKITEKFREVLESAIERALDAEAEVAALQEQIETLQEELAARGERE